MSGLSLKVLGPLILECETLRPRRRLPLKGTALIVFLAVQGGPIPRGKLADLLWPYQSSDGARHSLRNCLLQIRQSFGRDVIRTDFRDCSIEASTDAHEFKALAQSNNSRDLQRALHLYRAGFLLDFPAVKSEVWEEWVTAEHEALDSLARSTAVKLATIASAAGDHAVAIAAARRAVELDRLDENAHKALIRVLSVAGQPGSAVLAYDSYRRMLRRELGVDPEPRQALMARSLRGSPSLVEAPHDWRAECLALGTKAQLALAGVDGATPGKRLFAEMAALLVRLGTEDSQTLADAA